MCERSQSLTFKQNVDWGFPSPYYTSYERDRYSTPLHKDVFSGCYVLLKNSNWAFVAGLGPETNFWACLWLLQGPHHIAKCWLSTQHLILFLIFCLETPRDSSAPNHFWIEPPLASLSEISFPCTPACPGTQYSSTVCHVEISFNTFWH
jgi:hypothetical protein